MKKTSEEKILDRILEKSPSDNDQFYVEYRTGTDKFICKKDKKQQEKDNLFCTILHIEKKIARSHKNTEKQVSLI